MSAWGSAWARAWGSAWGVLAGALVRRQVVQLHCPTARVVELLTPIDRH